MFVVSFLLFYHSWISKLLDKVFGAYFIWTMCQHDKVLDFLLLKVPIYDIFNHKRRKVYLAEVL